MFDTHCHLTYPGLADRVTEVLGAAHAAGVDRMITVGTTPADAANAVALAHAHDGVNATVGLHPHHCDEGADRAALRDVMQRYAGDARVVALGEMGLDYHYDDPPRDVQQRTFQWQLEIAAELSAGDAAAGEMPLIIHNRKATDDVLAMIGDSGLAGERFVFHCFSGDREAARRILDIGAMISFTGIVTFKNATDVADAADHVPMERLMVETDSPYLTPAPYRKLRPNEPRYVVEVARCLAERRGMSFEEFTAQADANAARFFALPA